MAPRVPRVRTGRPRRRPVARSDGRHGRRTGLIAAVVSVVSALVVSLVAYFTPGLWERVTRLQDDTDLAVTVLFDDQFDTPTGAVEGEHVWPMAANVIPRGSTPADALTHGAADAETTLIRLNVRGTSQTKVTIHKIDVVVTRRDPPLRGVWVTGDQGGGANVRYLHADLDRETLGWSDQDGVDIGPISVYVTDTEEENFDILAQTETCDCHWRVRLTYTVADRQPRSVTIGRPDGRDLRTTSLSNAAVLRPEGCREPTVPGPPLCGDLPQLPAAFR